MYYLLPRQHHVLAELLSSVQEERHKAKQTRQVRTEFHSTLAGIEKWLKTAAEATCHDRDEISERIAEAITVSPL